MRALKGALLVYLLVKALQERFPDKQIGKTLIQKLMYFCEKDLREDFGYTMYYYGPYSSEVTEFLNLAEATGILEIGWEPSKGYSITAKENDSVKLVKVKVTDAEKEVIENVVKKYGEFSALELSVIATAEFLKENYSIVDIDNLAKTILSVKRKLDYDWVKGILNRAGIK